MQAQLLPPPGKVVTLPDGRRLMSRPKARSMGKLEPVYLPKVGGESEGVLITWGEAEVRNGPGTCFVEGCGCEEFHFVTRNKIVGQGLRSLCNWFILDNRPSGDTPFQTNALTRSYIRVGTGSGATIDATTGLVTPVATNPSSTLASVNNLTAGVYRFSFLATWNTGTITGATVTEFGIFGNLPITLNSNSQTVLALFARLSVTDTEFSSFVINTAAPLVIEYRVTNAFT